MRADRLVLSHLTKGPNGSGRARFIASARAALLLAASILSGCGGGSSSTADGAGTPNPSQAGQATLIRQTLEPNGSNCANGGIAVHAGIDLNGNGQLDLQEISTTQYVCHGADGLTGLNVLVATSPEPAGANCAQGGSRVSAGLDANRNGILDAAEITSTAYVCNGTPGPGVTWVEVTGTAVQANANTGYLANHPSAQVSITLPAAPALGEVVQVMGTGAGGWRIVQNAGQQIVTRAIESPGARWTARESSRSWRSIASSTDGTRLAAADWVGKIYTSTDSGASWTPRGADGVWRSIASSADGTRLAAVTEFRQIYTSTDSGVTWIARESNRNWRAIASSADGTHLVAGIGGGQIYTSTDSGVTWTARESSRNWLSIASSADGTRLAAVEYGGQIYTSTDSGATWTARETNRNWTSIASSTDGTRLAAVANGGQIYTSTDSGVNWTARESNRLWLSIASSADGIRLAAGTSGGQIYTSIDSGVTWTARESNRTWRSIASSADGTRLAAVHDGGQIYTSTPFTTLGTAGGISGPQFSAIHLQHLGSGMYGVLSHTGDLTAH